MNKINVGGHGRSPFCNGNFKSTNICRTEACLGHFRTVKIPSKTERIKQKNELFCDFFCFRFPLDPSASGQIMNLKNSKLAYSVCSATGYPYIGVEIEFTSEVNYHLEYRGQISLTFSLKTVYSRGGYSLT